MSDNALSDSRGRQHFHSYANLCRQIDTTLQTLLDQDVKPDSRIILPFETRIGTICGFLAAIGVGALPLSVKTVSAAGGRANFERFALSLAQRFDATHIMGGTNVEGLIPLPVAVRSSMVPGRGKDPLSAFPVHRSEEVAFVQFSSGTTATPKGVPITQGKLIEQLEMIIAQDEGVEDGAGASWLPLYHDMGLIGALLTCLYRGRTLHLSTPTGFMLDPVEWLLSLSEHAISTAVLPNFAIRYLLKRLDDTEHGQLAALDLSPLRRIFIGSDAIDAHNLERFIDYLGPYGLSKEALCPCYGMAEAVLMVSCRPPNQSYRRDDTTENGVSVSVGRILPPFELRITDEDGRTCTDAEVGELRLKGGTLADRYFEDERPLLDREGFYATGDLGYTQDGELYITGRCGDRLRRLNARQAVR